MCYNSSMTTITRDQLSALLHTGECVVEFTKVDGTVRSMPCTLNEALLPPPPVHITNTDNFDISQQFPDGLERSKSLAALYQHIAELHGCHFFDAGQVAQTSSIDGIHLDALNHKRIAEGLTQKIELLIERGG